MSIEDRLKATAKNLEGKLQEAAGDLTGDPQMKAEGQAKQVEAQVEHTVENIKDKAQGLRGRVDRAVNDLDR